MNKQQILWCVFVAIFVAPSALYFIVNGYWWLFDGNNPILDKMFASFMVTLIATIAAATWADVGEVWKKS